MATKEETKWMLKTKAVEFELTYFADLTMEDCLDDLGRDNQKGMFSISSWDFAERDFKHGNIYGECKTRQRKIFIRLNEEYETSLLHEMIHAYESMLDEFPNLKQYALVRLFQKVSRKQAHIMNLIKTDLQPMSEIHSPFFLLKSIDIDHKRKLPLGTIYAYERNEFFADPSRVVRWVDEMTGENNSM